MMWGGATVAWLLDSSCCLSMMRAQHHIRMPLPGLYAFRVSFSFNHSKTNAFSLRQIATNTCLDAKDDRPTPIFRLASQVTAIKLVHKTGFLSCCESDCDGHPRGVQNNGPGDICAQVYTCRSRVSACFTNDSGTRCCLTEPHA